ncbi:MAG: radical SAM protein [Deltaproteobacteria bacterium]|nr:radical SAM protein [Deltaproteobacteria bacterium]
MSVLLLQPPLSIHRDFVDYPYHCDLGVVQAHAVLAAEGLEARVVDAFALPGSGLKERADGRLLLGASFEGTLAAVRAHEPRLLVVAFSPFHRPPQREPLLGSLLGALRELHPELPFLLADLYQSGQHHLAVEGEAVLEAYPEVDGYLLHEAEGRLPALCRELLASGRPTRRRAESGGEHAGYARLPPPSWDEVDLEARDAFLERVVVALGRGSWAFPVDGRTLPALSSRGCPYRCVHCSSNPGREPGSKKTQRRLAPEVLEAHLEALVKTHGATRIDLLDEMVNFEPEHFERVLGKLGELGVAYDFPNGMRADWVQPAHLDAMRGRIATFSVSAESGAQRVVDEVVQKALDLGRLEETVREARARGLRTLVHFMIGLPGETKAEINQTLDFALHLHDAYGVEPAVQFATPLPGTALAARAGAGEEVADYTPLFQHQASTATGDFDREELERFRWTFEQRLRAGQGPQKVIVNVTYRCNNHCHFCAVGTRSQLDGNFDRQRELLVRYHAQGVRLLDLDGGEPTLYPKLLPLIAFARRLGYERINVTTNGRMCSYEAFARKLVTSGLSSVLFSLHGSSAEIHGAQTGVPESFAQTCQGIRNCVAAAPPGVELGLNVTLTRGNTADLPDLAALAHDLGLRWMNVQFLTPFGRATEDASPDLEEAARVTMEVIDAWQDRMKLQVINLPFCFMPGYERFLVGDLLKLERHMLFVNNEDVNLYDYLREQRHHEAQCEGCPHRCFCGGFYRLEDTPEAPWEITPAEVDAPV